MLYRLTTYAILTLAALGSAGPAFAEDGHMSQKYQRSDAAMSTLTDEQKYVILHDGTEKPFENKYWDNKEPGIYVDATTGEPLFSSTDKYDSGTGWPSFTRPISDHFVTEQEDNKLLMSRTEVRSKYGDSHLGHVFDDGPQEAGGRRFCINSAALRFVPVAEMEQEGYGEYLSLFEE